MSSEHERRANLRVVVSNPCPERPEPGREGILRRLDAPAGTLALTFDDGPDPDYTPRILDVLAAADVRATFFLLGAEAVRHPELVRRLLREGHGIGSHGWNHRHPWRVPAAEAWTEVNRATEALTELSGRPPRWFRPPHGRRNRYMFDAARQQGQTVALWSRSALDWGPFGTARGVARRLERVQEGDIVLLHDGRNRHNRPEATLAALPRMLATLEARGLKPVLLDGKRTDAIAPAASDWVEL